MKKKLLLIGMLLVAQKSQAAFIGHWVHSISHAFHHAFHEVYNGISYASRAAYNAAKHAAEAAAAKLKEAAEAAAHAVKDLEEKAVSTLEKTVAQVKADVQKQVINQVAKAIEDAKNTAIAAAQEVAEKAKDAANMVKDTAETVGKGVTDAANTVANVAVDSTNAVKGAVDTAVDATVDNVYDKGLKVAYDKTKGGIEKGVNMIKNIIHPPNLDEEKIEALQKIVDGVQKLEGPVVQAAQNAIKTQATLKLFLDTQLAELTSHDDTVKKSFTSVIPALQNTFQILTTGTTYKELECPTSAPCADYLNYVVNMVKYIFEVDVHAVQVKIAEAQKKAGKPVTPVSPQPTAPELATSEVIEKAQKRMAQKKALTELIKQVKDVQVAVQNDYKKAFTGLEAFKNFFANALPADVNAVQITKESFAEVLEAMKKVVTALTNTTTVGKSTLAAYNLMGCSSLVNTNENAGAEKMDASVNQLTTSVAGIQKDVAAVNTAKDHADLGNAVNSLNNNASNIDADSSASSEEPEKLVLSPMSEKCTALEQKLGGTFDTVFNKIIEALQAKLDEVDKAS